MATPADHAALQLSLNAFFDAHSKDEREKFDAEVFRGLYKQFLEEPAHIDWNSWRHLREEVQKDYDKLPEFDGRKEVLDRVVVLKLNGGLGTTMGCSGPKSLIRVKDSYTFLDLAIKHVETFNKANGSNVPLLLMHSFNTDDAVWTHLNITQQLEAVHSFVQSKCPRIYADTLLPVEEPEHRWYPPGHGNFFASLAFSGWLDRLLEEGRDICFVSNVDNTGAGIDTKIVQFMADSGADYVMEVTPKTQADIKGGTLIEIKGHIMHLEMPQVSPDHLDEFCSTKTFKSSRGISVPRRRFLPVKKNDDLLAVSSNLYSLEGDFTLKLQASTLPCIQLSQQFQTVDEFHSRFAMIPHMCEVTRLIVAGNVFFEADVTLKGSIEIRTGDDDESKVIVPKGSVLSDYTLNKLK